MALLLTAVCTLLFIIGMLLRAKKFLNLSSTSVRVQNFLGFESVSPLIVIFLYQGPYIIPC